MTQLIAVDWSGRAKGEGEATWLARVVGGELVELRNGRTREQVVEDLVGLAANDPRTFVGLDFAFSFPRWYCEQEGWRSGHEAWRAMEERAEEILAACPAPFWGRSGTTRPADKPQQRVTEQGTTAKSVFQIGGAGAVGTGSLRGMPVLERLAQAGYSIWPFDDPGQRCVLEIYPRLLTGERLTKTRYAERWAYMDRHHPEQPERMRERAAGSEDAFDAAVSALAMARHLDELEALPPVARDSPDRIEGRIWLPRGTG